MSNPDSDSGSDSMPISVPNCFKSAEEARRFSAQRDGLSDSSTESDAVEVGVDVDVRVRWRISGEIDVNELRQLTIY